MTTLAALLGDCRWRSARARVRSCAVRSGITIVGGLIFSQVLTLYTTPVIYLWFDRLAKRLSPSRGFEAGPEPAFTD